MVVLAFSLSLSTFFALRPDPDRTPRSVTLEGTAGAPLALTPVFLDAAWLARLSHVQRRYFVQSRAPVWQLSRTLPAGHHTVRVSVDGTIYGAGGRPEGPPIEFDLETERPVTFLYSHDRHALMTDATEPVVVASGDFQTALGCATDFDDDCLHSWMQDVDGDGRFTLSTRLIPVGTWQIRPAARLDGPAPVTTRFTVRRRSEEVLLSWRAGSPKVTVEFPERPPPLPGEVE